jgi:hypothetical protein
LSARNSCVQKIYVCAIFLGFFLMSLLMRAPRIDAKPQQGALSIVSPLALDKTSVRPGQTLNGSVTYQNTGSTSVSVNQIVITARPPGGTNPGGPYYDFSPRQGPITLQPGQTVTVSASYTFASTDPTGSWYSYATYQDSASVWHDGPNVPFTVSNQQDSFSIVRPLALDKTNVSPGQTLNGTVTYQNTGSTSVSVNQIVITARPPGGTNSGGPYYDFSPRQGPITLQPGQTVTVSASRTFASTDPTGSWYSYATYQDSGSVWHDGPNVPFTLSNATVNQPPTVNAGPDQTITLPASANLHGSASDDGLPSGTLTTAWSKLSGPGAVTFGNANALDTTAGFSTDGAYVLQLAASDGEKSSTDTINVVVKPNSGGITYYVSNSGDDGNSGVSPDTPWRTMSRVQDAISSLRAGDSVLFQRGGIWFEELDISSVNGSPGSPITFGNYGSGNLPIVDGGGVRNGFSVDGGREWCIGGRSTQMSYITIDGFECRNTSSYGIAFVSARSGSAGIVVQNSSIHDTGNGDFGYHNQLMFHEPVGGDYGTKFLNNTVFDCFGHNCIQIHGDRGGPLISGNECYGSMHNCIDLKLVQRAVVDGNLVHNGFGTEQASEGIYMEMSTPDFTSDATISHNVVYGTGFAAGIQCQEAGGPVTCYIYNNTVFESVRSVWGGADSGDTSLVHFYVKNNIFDTPSARGGGTFIEWDYNNNVREVPIGPHDLNVDPRYVNAGAHDFRLQAGSPVIDKGTNVGYPYNGAGPDMGAFESN